MDWSAEVDIYCERLDPSFWAEPLNALSNLAFLVAAFIAFRAVRRAGRPEFLTAVMILLAVAVGVGSFLFHTVATRWAGVADTAPILLFILLYLYLAGRRFLSLPVMAALAVPVIFTIFAAVFTDLWRGALPSLNGSEAYLPVVLALLLFGVILRLLRHPAAGALIQAAAVFTLSLTFRSLDHAVCGRVPVGAHFLWHCLNGLVLAIVMLAFIRHGAPRPARLAPRPDGG